MDLIFESGMEIYKMTGHYEQSSESIAFLNFYMCVIEHICGKV